MSFFWSNAISDKRKKNIDLFDGRFFSLGRCCWQDKKKNSYANKWTFNFVFIENRNEFQRKTAKSAFIIELKWWMLFPIEHHQPTAKNMLLFVCHQWHLRRHLIRRKLLSYFLLSFPLFDIRIYSINQIKKMFIVILFTLLHISGLTWKSIKTNMNLIIFILLVCQKYYANSHALLFDPDSLTVAVGENISTTIQLV